MTPLLTSIPVGLAMESQVAAAVVPCLRGRPGQRLLRLAEVLGPCVVRRAVVLMAPDRRVQQQLQMQLRLLCWLRCSGGASPASVLW